MLPKEYRHRGCFRMTCMKLMGLMLLAGIGLAPLLRSQEIGPAPAALGQEPAPLESKKPADQKTLSEFLEPLSVNDAVIEITVGQGRIITTKIDLTAPGKAPALVAVGDPSVVDFTVINARQIRVVGQRTGVTDLVISTGDGKTYNFEVRVLANLTVLRAQLQQSFPDASVKLSQLRDHVVVEGQARDATQVHLILKTVKTFLASVEGGQERKVAGQKQPGRPDMPKAAAPDEAGKQPAAAAPEGSALKISGTIVEPQVINLLRVPGPQQVLLKVRVAELNRTALREIGADMLYANAGNGTLIGTQIGGASVGATGNATGKGGITAASFLNSASNTTIFGIFEREFEMMIRALRKNDMLKILAEPNLVAMNGHRADFLAGGEFPVPVPQGGAGGASTVTIEWKQFGVKLGFLPTILDSGSIRLSVDPEVSSLDFSIGTVLQAGGTPVPGLNTRKAHSTVELREGQTLAIAGLLSVTLDGSSGRIPGLGDLPVLGPFFSNTTSKRTEKELIVLITPYLVEAMHCDQVPPYPGADVHGPNDLEFFLGNRIEGKSGRDWRATTGHYTTAPGVLPALFRLQGECLRGPYGYCE